MDRGLKIKYGTCAHKPDKLIVLNVISEGIKCIFQNLKSAEALQTSVHFGTGWKGNVSLGKSLQVILISFRLTLPWSLHVAHPIPVAALAVLKC